ncbi:MAG: DUF4167 domain-containing protein [Hyphomicrobiales bacterium]
MRPGSNKRMRGRNRRGPNPLARSYESNGPDVKVRGTAQHIADRYLQLARDAQSSGDPVTAESYFQYAEHYLRIIAAAQEQMQGQYGYRPRADGGTEDEGEGEGEEGDAESFGTQQYAGSPPNGGFNGQPHQAPRSASGNAPLAGDEQPPMFSSPPRERFENRNQRFESRDGWNRQNRNEGNRTDGNRNDGNRNVGGRPDGNRNDNPRREPYRRDASGEGGSSADFSGEARPQQPRGGQAEGGGDQHGPEQRRFQGQHGSESRGQDRPHRDRFERSPRPVVAEEQVLPSFITAPVRPAAPVAETAPVEPVEAKEARTTVASPVELAAPASEAAVTAPRPRRGRPRRVVDPSPDAEEEAAAPGDDTSSIAAK